MKYLDVYFRKSEFNIISDNTILFFLQASKHDIAVVKAYISEDGLIITKLISTPPKFIDANTNVIINVALFIEKIQNALETIQLSQ